MAWTNIANANLDVGAPVRSVDILALRDNVSAVPNGDSGAPRIKAQALNGGQSGNAPIYAARAWVNFDGTNAFVPNPSTTAIRGSGNISSITKNGTGDYTINFTTAMPNANYSITSTTNQTVSLDTPTVCIKLGTTPTTSAVNIITGNDAGSPVNTSIISVSIFG